MPSAVSSRAAGRPRARRRGAGVVAWLRAHPAAAAALLYLVLATVMFAPGLVPGRTLSASDLLYSATPWAAGKPADVPALGSNFEQADAVTQFQPQIQVVRRSLPHVPLWDPSMLSGRPLIADPQAQIFSPFSVPLYVLPFWKGLAVSAILKVFLAAFGAFLLARAIGLRVGGALLTGLAYGFGLWCVTWVSWTLGSVWVLLPWVCLMAEVCLRRPGPLPVAGLAVAVGAQWLGGHPSSSFQTLVVVACVWTVRALASRERRRRALPSLAALAAGLLLGTALAALMLVPFGELLAHSDDLASRKAARDLLHQPPRFLLGVALPDFWGHGRSELVFGSQQQERAYYIGVLPLVLAVAGLVLRPRVERVVAAVIAVAAFAAATGLPPVYRIVVALPGFASANSSRLAVIGVLALAVLAGWGLDELAGTPPGRRWRAVLAAGVAVVAVPVILAASRLDLDALAPAARVAFAFATPKPDLAASAHVGAAAVVRLASVLQFVLLGLVAIALLALRGRGRLGSGAVIAIALAVVTVDLFGTGLGQNPAIPIDHAVQPTTPALRFLQAHRTERFTALKPVTPSVLVLPIPPNVAMRYGVQDARGYVLPTEKRYSTLWRQAIATSRGCYYFFCVVLADSRPQARRALGVLGVRYLVQDPHDPPLKGLRLAYDGDDARIYENPDAVPRAYLVDHQVGAPAGDQATADVLASPGFRPHGSVLTDDPIPGLATGPGSGPSGSARMTSYGRERVTVRTAARRPSLLVVTDSWYPGWKARVDGADAPVRRVDGVLRGVNVPAGTHTVVLRYEPASWRIGWVTSLLALLLVAVLVVVGLRRRGTARPAP